MAQVKDLIVSGASRFLNTINGNINGTATNVTGTVAISNGGTGATTRLGAAKALTDETVATPGYVVGLTDSWGKFGYTSIANLKTTLGAMTPASHTHGNIQNGGTLQTTDITIASGDKLVVTDSSDSAKIARTSISFDGSTTTKCLTQKGTWETFGTSNLTIGTTASTAMAGNTNVNNVTQTPTTTNSSYELLFSNTATDNTEHTESTRKSNKLIFNPNTPQLNIIYGIPGGRSDTTSIKGGSIELTSNMDPGDMTVSHSNITLDTTWDGTNTSLVTAVTDKLSKSNGGTVSGDLTITGTNGLYLGTSDTSSNDSADIIFTYGDSTEKARIWTETTMNNAGSILHYRYNNSSGTNVFSGYLMTSEVQSAQVAVSVLSNNIMMYKCGRIVYFSIIGDYNASLPSRVTTTVGSVTAADWQPITTCDSGLKGHNNQVSMQITSTGSVTMYNYTTAAISSGWFRWSGCYITKQ